MMERPDSRASEKIKLWSRDAGYGPATALKRQLNYDKVPSLFCVVQRSFLLSICSAVPCVSVALRFAVLYNV